MIEIAIIIAVGAIAGLLGVFFQSNRISNNTPNALLRRVEADRQTAQNHAAESECRNVRPALTGRTGVNSLVTGAQFSHTKFKLKADAFAGASGLNSINLDGEVLHLGPLQKATHDTFSPEGLRKIGALTVVAFVEIGVIDVVLNHFGYDVIHGSTADLVTAILAEHGHHAGVGVAAMVEHGTNAAEIAGHAGDVTDTIMHVMSGGLTLLASVSASYFVGKYTKAKLEERKVRHTALVLDLTKRRAYQSLFQALRRQSCSQQEWIQPATLLLASGVSPSTLA